VFLAKALSACGPGEPEPHDPGPLKAAAAAVAVTPPIETFEDTNANGRYDFGEPFEDLDGDGAWSPIWIAGFSNGRYAVGVHDPIYARVLVVERDDTRIAIVSVDWVGLLYDDALWLRRMAAEAGLELDHLVLSSTHNHEGPDTVGIWGQGIFATGRDPAYLERSFEAVVAALGEAVAELTPVRLRAGTGQTEGLVHDSRKPQAFDERVTALRFDRRADGGPLAVVVHWANHPEALDSDNQLLTADFPAGVVAGIEEAAPGAVGIFWQGALGGLLNPLHVDVQDEQGQVLPDESFEKADRMGRLVAAEALAALERGQDATGGDRLAFGRRELLLPTDNEEIVLAGQIGLFERKIYDQDGREIAPGVLLKPWIKSEVAVIDIGDVQFAAVPGELYPELAMVGPAGETYTQQPQDPGADFQGVECVAPIEAAMRATPYRIVLGLANDELGYLIPKCQYDRDAPFAYGRDSAQYGEGFCPGPDIPDMLVTAIAEELAALNAVATRTAEAP
jgi:hypothetical protein